MSLSRPKNPFFFGSGAGSDGWGVMGMLRFSYEITIECRYFEAA